MSDGATRPGQRPRLHIASLPAAWGNSEASAFFAPFGTIVDLIVFRDHIAQRSKYGFIEFSKMEEAQAAIAATHAKQVDDAVLDVKFAVPKPGASAQYGPGAQGVLALHEMVRLYVGNIGTGSTEENIRTEFEPFGKLTEVSMWVNQKASLRRGGEESLSAFVQFEKHADAKAAKEALHGKNVLRGREPELAEKAPDFIQTPPLIVDFAKPKNGQGAMPYRPSSYSGGRRDDYRDNYRGGAEYSRDRDHRGGGYDDRRSSSRSDDRGYGGGSSRGYEDRGSSRGYDDRYDDRRYDSRDSYRRRSRSRSRSPRRRY